MLTEEEITRYSRQIQLADFGLLGQEAISAAKVLVVGAGGLGCPVIQYLAAAGIGNITIVDGDIISVSNLQRQILYRNADLGKDKASVASERAKQINPFVHVNSVCNYLSVELAFELIQSHDIVVDCSDNFGTRNLVNDICVLLKKPFVTAALYKHEGQLSVNNILQQDGTYSTNLNSIFPDNRNSLAELNCNEAGVMATLPGIMGLYQANEVLKYFVNKATCMLNKLLVIDSKWMSHQIFSISIGDETNLSREKIFSFNYSLPRSSKNNLSIISDKELLLSVNQNEFMLVDVREENELPKINNFKHLAIPISQLLKRAKELEAYNRIAFVCKSGARSATAVSLLETVFPKVVLQHYAKGAENLIRILDAESENIKRNDYAGK